MASAPTRRADSAFLSNDVRGTLDELRLGVTYNRELFGQDELEVTGFYSPRHLGPFVQIGVRIPQDFMNRGGNIRYLNAAPIAGRENRFTVGVDYQNTPIMTGVFSSTTGAPSAELEENAATFGVYALEEFELLPSLALILGGRYDNVHFSSRNLIAAGAPRASRTFERFTPKVGLTYQPLPALSLYANYSRGFETPIIGELRQLPSGEFRFNQDLDPRFRPTTRWAHGASRGNGSCSSRRSTARTSMTSSAPSGPSRGPPSRMWGRCGSTASSWRRR